MKKKINGQYRVGVYNFMGNFVEYDGETVYDVDADEELPLEALALADFIGKDE